MGKGQVVESIIGILLSYGINSLENRAHVCYNKIPIEGERTYVKNISLIIPCMKNNKEENRGCLSIDSMVICIIVYATMIKNYSTFYPNLWLRYTELCYDIPS